MTTQPEHAPLTAAEQRPELSDLEVTALADRWTVCHPHHSQAHTPNCDATTLAIQVERIAIARAEQAEAALVRVTQERDAERARAAAVLALAEHWRTSTSPETRSFGNSLREEGE